MHPDLQTRILVPSASVPPSTGTPGLWRRKSSTGAVDAQGNLLIHPMVGTDKSHCQTRSKKLNIDLA
jgi:hypothetical protein